MSEWSLVECFLVIRDPVQESKIEHELIDVLVLCVWVLYEARYRESWSCSLKMAARARFF